MSNNGMDLKKILDPEETDLEDIGDVENLYPTLSSDSDISEEIFELEDEAEKVGAALTYLKNKSSKSTDTTREVEFLDDNDYVEEIKLKYGEMMVALRVLEVEADTGVDMEGREEFEQKRDEFISYLIGEKYNQE